MCRGGPKIQGVAFRAKGVGPEIASFPDAKPKSTVLGAQS